MNEQPTPTLLPCPFCGAEAVITEFRKRLAVNCKNPQCFAQQKGEKDSYTSIIAAWNTRAESADLSTARADAAKLRGVLADLHRVTKALLCAGTIAKAQDDAWAEYGHGIIPRVEAALAPNAETPQKDETERRQMKCPTCKADMTPHNHGICPKCKRYCGCSFMPESLNDYCKTHRPKVSKKRP